ncbi:MAG: DUF1269 domain-containing protein [Dehalococcoidia bacterium]|nr:DUF1269 domain-containing protein [Dehalococcoidia bacterium]
MRQGFRSPYAQISGRTLGSPTNGLSAGSNRVRSRCSPSRRVAGSSRADPSDPARSRAGRSRGRRRRRRGRAVRLARTGWRPFVTVMLYAALVRGTHVFSAGFPLGDGGMFYAMARDLQASAYALPDQIASLTGAGALSGAFWGTLIGLIFMVPVLGLAVGAISGALSGKAMDLGVDDRFIKDVGDAMVPGTSALFLLVVQATPDKVIAEMKEFGGNIVQTNLTQAR